MTTQTTMVRHIRDTYSRATDEQRAAGTEWYAHAHDVAGELFDDVEVGAGILAALSPLTPWQRNVALAAMVANGTPCESLPTLGTARQACARILAGESWRDVLRGDKVRAFAAAIVAAGDTDTVCVDRHARDIAYGVPFHGAGHKRSQDSRVTRSEYESIARAYVLAARRERTSAAVLQAVTWTAHRGTAN